MSSSGRTKYEIGPISLVQRTIKSMKQKYGSNPYMADDVKMVLSICRVDGQVPCVAIGKDHIDTYDVSKREITGICFQQVDNGLVKPVLESNIFSPVEWTNSPTARLQQRHPTLLNLNRILGPIPLKWHKFGLLMFHLKDVIIAKMTNPDAQEPPTSLLEGFQKDYWVGGANNSATQTVPNEFIRSVKQMLIPFWVDDLGHKKWVELVVRGFSSSMGFIETFLPSLVGIEVSDEADFVQAPVEISEDHSIVDGVVHCLVYGCNELQTDIVEKEYLQHRQANGRNRGRLRQRTLVPRAKSDRSRSRSRSPSPENDNLLDHVVNARNQMPSIGDMLQNPGDYKLQYDKLHNYFEPHKPNFLHYKQRNNGIEAKVLVEVSSFERFGFLPVEKHLAKVTEQCFRACLSGLWHNQDEITGLIIVPDGMKLIQVRKQNDPENTIIYTMEETDLIDWQNTEGLHRVLYHLQQAMQ